MACSQIWVHEPASQLLVEFVGEPMDVIRHLWAGNDGFFCSYFKNLEKCQESHCSTLEAPMEDKRKQKEEGRRGR